jgi:hypothetical protein
MKKLNLLIGVVLIIAMAIVPAYFKTTASIFSQLGWCSSLPPWD